MIERRVNIYWRKDKKYYLASSSKSAEKVYWEHGEPLVLADTTSYSELGAGVLKMLDACQPGIHAPHYYKERAAYDAEVQKLTRAANVDTYGKFMSGTRSCSVMLDDNVLIFEPSSRDRKGGFTPIKDLTQKLAANAALEDIGTRVHKALEDSIG